MGKTVKRNVDGIPATKEVSAGAAWGRRPGSSVLRLNVVLLSFLAALLALATAGKTVSAHQQYADSVTGGPPTYDYRFIWNGSPPDFIDARNYALDQWTALRKVQVYRSDSPQVVFRQINASTGNDAVGYWTPYTFSADTIDFYRYNINRFSFTTCDRRWVGNHEVGHAFGLAHSESTQTQWSSVMYWYHKAGWNICSYRQHDVDDYNARYIF